jgi:hypothetical protein
MRIEKTQVVVIDIDAVVQPPLEAADLGLGGRAVTTVAGHLVGQPQLAGPEAVGPLDIVDRRIDAVDAGGRREALGEDLEVAVYAGENLGEDRVEVGPVGRTAAQQRLTQLERFARRLGAR